MRMTSHRAPIPTSHNSAPNAFSTGDAFWPPQLNQLSICYWPPSIIRCECVASRKAFLLARIHVSQPPAVGTTTTRATVEFRNWPEGPSIWRPCLRCRCIVRLRMEIRILFRYCSKTSIRRHQSMRGEGPEVVSVFPF